MTIEVQQQQQRRGSQLPAGFRFHPTDEELIVHYLRKRASSSASASSPPWPGVIAEVDIYKLDPWELPSSNEQLGNNGSTNNECMYFFSPRDRKYPNGVRPNRAAGSGYWKATGTDKPIVSSSSQGVVVGVKKALVFYQGRPPKGIKTNWIMHEYRLADARPHAYRPPPTVRSSSSSSSSSMRLDDWVLCRIYKKPDPQLSQLLLHHDHQLPSSSSMDSQQQQHQHQQDHYDSSSSTSRMPMPMSMSMPRPPSISDYLEDYSAVSHLFDTLPPPDTGAGFVLSDDEASTTRKRDNSDNGGVVDTMRASKRSMFGPDQLTMNSNFSMFGPDQHQLLPANSSKDRL